MTMPRIMRLYPIALHGLSLPSYQRDRLERYLAWFDKHLKVGK
jgi:dipeptidyl aminopeptidase/acylaminoacyl peptidase